LGLPLRVDRLHPGRMSWHDQCDRGAELAYSKSSARCAGTCKATGTTEAVRTNATSWRSHLHPELGIDLEHLRLARSARLRRAARAPRRDVRLPAQSGRHEFGRVRKP
jgi:hypothetical protein